MSKKHILITEEDIGTSDMTDDLEDAFLESCKHNETTPEDLEYFRSYVWNLFAIMSLSIDRTKKRLIVLEQDDE